MLLRVLAQWRQEQPKRSFRRLGVGKAFSATGNPYWQSVSKACLYVCMDTRRDTCRKETRISKLRNKVKGVAEVKISAHIMIKSSRKVRHVKAHGLSMRCKRSKQHKELT